MSPSDGLIRTATIFEAPSLAAARMCTGLAAEWFLLRQLHTLIAQWDGGGMLPYGATVRDGAVRVNAIFPKGKTNPFDDLLVTEPVFDRGLLSHFTWDGVRLDSILRRAGVSEGGSAVAWVARLAPRNILELTFVDVDTASAIPERRNRPSTIHYARPVGTISDIQRSAWGISGASAWKLGRDGFVGSVQVAQNADVRMGRQPFITGPPLADIESVTIFRLDQDEPWLKFHPTAGSDDIRLARPAPADEPSEPDPADRWLQHPNAQRLAPLLDGELGDLRDPSSTDHRIRLAAATAVYTELQRQDVPDDEALFGAIHLATTLDHDELHTAITNARP